MDLNVFALVSRRNCGISLEYIHSYWWCRNVDITIPVDIGPCLKAIRRITRTDRMRNSQVREETFSSESISDLIRYRRFRWFGHVCRIPLRIAYQEDLGLWKEDDHEKDGAIKSDMITNSRWNKWRGVISTEGRVRLAYSARRDIVDSGCKCLHFVIFPRGTHPHRCLLFHFRLWTYTFRAQPRLLYSTVSTTSFRLDATLPCGRTRSWLYFKLIHPAHWLTVCLTRATWTVWANSSQQAT